MLKRLIARTPREESVFDPLNEPDPNPEIGPGLHPTSSRVDLHGYFKTILANRHYVIAASLLVAACVIAVDNVATVMTWHVPVPFSDEWIQLPGMIGLHDAGFPAGRVLSYLWAQHNEHRIVVPRIIYLMDMTLFGYRGYFPIVCIFVFQLLLAGMLAWLFVGKRRYSWETFLLVSLALVAAFNLVQWENFASTFQTSFVGCFAFSVAALVLYAKHALTGRALYLWCTILFAMLASLSLASGLFVWIVLALLAFLVHSKRYRHSLFFVGVFLAFMSLYVHGYTSPPYHANPVDSLIHHPLKVFDYLTVWLGNVAGTVFAARLLGLMALLALLVVMAYLTLDKDRSRRVEIYTLLAICLLVVLSGLVTSLARINFGLDQAMASRYATPALILWVSLLGCLLLLALDSGPPLDVGIIVGFILVAFVGLLFRSDYATTALVSFQNRQFQTYLAMVTGLYKVRPELLASPFPPPLQILDKVDSLKSHNISSFSAAETSPLKIGGTFPPRSMQRTDSCKGHVDAVSPTGQDTYQVTGWAWDEGSSTYPEWVVLVKDGNIVGLGKPGIQRPDVYAVVPSVKKRRVGWQGIAGGSSGMGAQNIEAYVSTRSGHYCRF